jgi:hypothetical protein
MGGYGERGLEKQSASLASSWEGECGMLQWKPKLIALVAILVLVAAVSGQFTWDSFEQFTWF